MKALTAGLADAAHDSQRIFRTVLDAFAHPGRIVAVPVEVEAPAALNAAATALVLTLIDRDTPLWLAPCFDSPELHDFVRFHTGAPIATRPEDAAFAVVPGDREPMFDGFAVGTDPFPDRSATLIVQVPALRGGPHRTLRGPGIESMTEAAVAGLAPTFWRDWAANHALFPCGVDVVFAAGIELLALPRSIVVET